MVIPFRYQREAKAATRRPRREVFAGGGVKVVVVASMGSFPGLGLGLALSREIRWLRRLRLPLGGGEKEPSGAGEDEAEVALACMGVRFKPGTIPWPGVDTRLEVLEG